MNTRKEQEISEEIIRKLKDKRERIISEVAEIEEEKLWGEKKPEALLSALERIPESVKKENREIMSTPPFERIRQFESGATRDSEDGKLDFDGFLSPSALKRYAEYMHKHRMQSNGEIRASDNWQKGIPLEAYMKSLWRHLVEFWTEHRYQVNCEADDDSLREELLCAIIFNAFGYLHELRKESQ